MLQTFAKHVKIRHKKVEAKSLSIGCRSQKVCWPQSPVAFVAQAVQSTNPGVGAQSLSERAEKVAGWAWGGVRKSEPRRWRAWLERARKVAGCVDASQGAGWLS